MVLHSDACSLSNVVHCGYSTGDVFAVLSKFADRRDSGASFLRAQLAADGAASGVT